MRSTLEASGQVASLTGDILRRKAMERLIEGATPIDGDGNEVDLTPPVIEDADDDTDVDTGTDESDAADVTAASSDDETTGAATTDVKNSGDGADNEEE